MHGRMEAAGPHKDRGLHSIYRLSEQRWIKRGRTSEGSGCTVHLEKLKAPGPLENQEELSTEIPGPGRHLTPSL